MAPLTTTTRNRDRGAALLAYRKSANLTQAQLSALLGIGGSTLSHLERGRRSLSPDRWEEAWSRFCMIQSEAEAEPDEAWTKEWTPPPAPAPAPTALEAEMDLFRRQVEAMERSAASMARIEENMTRKLGEIHVALLQGFRLLPGG